MSKSDGMKALNLEMPDRVPRTEYSVLGHPELVSRVTGIPVTSESDAETWKKAQQAFLKAWQFDFMWSVDISHDVFGRYYTDMGPRRVCGGRFRFPRSGEEHVRRRRRRARV